MLHLSELTAFLRKLKGGAIELGVHIADVSHFVVAGSHLDREARQRATTLYLADRRYDMLPPVLSANLCSLLGGVDRWGDVSLGSVTFLPSFLYPPSTYYRYAVSVMWKMDSRCEVEKVWYGRTLIRSSYQLSYEVRKRSLALPIYCSLGYRFLLAGGTGVIQW